MLFVKLGGDEPIPYTYRTSRLTQFHTFLLNILKHQPLLAKHMRSKELRWGVLEGQTGDGRKDKEEEQGTHTQP